MVNQLKAYLATNALDVASMKVLAAVSGGADSVVMFHLLREAGAELSITHCNFGLRGQESDHEELFVENLAKSTGTPFYVKRFDTKKIASDQGVSIQMAARELRYTWFEELLNQHGFSYVAVGHHADDQVETFFINLIRGSGPNGLKGMPFTRDKIIRPLLFARREQIEAYAAKNQIAFLNDSSNMKQDYLRNSIRHQVIPLLNSIDSRSPNGILTSIELLNNHIDAFSEMVHYLMADHIQHQDEVVRINRHTLEKFRHPDSLLFHVLKPYGFSGPIIGQIAESLRNSTGNLFYSNTHRLEIGHQDIILSKKQDKELAIEYRVPRQVSEIFEPCHVSFQILMGRELFVNENDPEIAYLDADKVKYPLTIRKWKKGDRFFPLGMHGSKLISDFFTDIKLSRYDKEKQWLICSASGEIMWVMGYRLDKRFSIVPQTKNLLRIEVHKTAL
ncbi:MAG: tRNA lysidine(34) synthetase TilS [Bacteroidales bacterium]|nr:tRNA lysidine(34) synthetase TilS [Bacteroidales bacterium]